MSAPSVHVCVCDGQFSYLVVNVENTSNCYVYSIDKLTGGLYYAGIPNVDLFQDSKSAILYLTETVNNSRWQYLGKYLIGATIFDNQLVIMYVISDETTAIYDGKPIKMIKSSDYYKIPLQNKTIEGDQSIFSFPMNENHFFCNYIDLARPFPFIDEKKESPDFFWNNRFSNIFDILRTPEACIRVLQGGAFSLNKDTNSTTNITYIIKRSSQNSGTRYEARGIDKNYNPANECECSLIFTINGENFGHSWRRGSAPIKWKTVLQSTFLAPQHIVMEKPDEFTPVYFSSIFKRFDLNKIGIISLLNESPDKGEVDLLQGYVKAVERTNKVLDNKILFNQIDINHIIANNKLKGRISIFENLSSVANSIEFTSSSTMQTELNRFNCADSLDRTNLMSFYYAIIVIYKFGLAHNIFVNEGEQSDDYTKNISQNVLDFICNAFIMTGNIISLMYTNTPAIKTEAIRALMTEQTAVSPDVYITCLRRFHNVASDPYRHQMFKRWNQVVPFDDMFFMDSLHLSSTLVPSKEIKMTINPSIFDEEIRYFYINEFTNQNIYIALPEPLILSTFSIMIPPRNSNKSSTFSICCGNNVNAMYPLIVDSPIPFLAEPQWCVYDIKDLMKRTSSVPISVKSLEPCSFINIRFNYVDSTLIIGNIKIGVERPKKKLLASQSIDGGRSLGSTISKMMQGTTMPSLHELCALDRWMLENRCSVITRNESLVRNLKNPYFFDIPSRLSENHDGECSFCHYRSNDLTKFGSFEPFTSYYRRFSNIEEPYHVAYLCPSCSEQIEAGGLPYYDESMLTDLQIANQFAERTTVMVDSYQPIFNIAAQSSIFYSSPNADPAELRELLNPTIAFRGWNTGKQAVQLVISFPSAAEVNKIMILLDKDCFKSLQVFTENWSELSIKSVDNVGNQTVVQYIDCEPTRCIIMMLEGNSDIVLKNIQIRGKMRKMRVGSEQIVVPEKVQPFKFKQYDGLFDFLTHTQTFRFQTPRRVQSITFKSDDFLAVYVVFINGGKAVDWQQLIMPRIESGTLIKYKFEDITGLFDEIRIFYLDKKPMSAPLDISFD